MNRFFASVFCLLSSVLAAAAAGRPVYVSGVLTEASTGAARTGDFTVTASLATNAAGPAVRTTAVGTVRTDANGEYGFAADLDVAGAFRTADDAWLTFAFSDGKAPTTLPAQRVGYVPYAVHADTAHEIAAEAVRLESLAVTKAGGVAALTATGAVTVTGNLIVTNGVTASRADCLVIDRLAVGSAGTALLGAAQADAKTLTLADGTLRTASLALDSDALVTVRAETDAGATLTLAVFRTDADGTTETLFTRDAVATGGRGGNALELTFPATSGDTVSVSAMRAGTGTASVTCTARPFGLKMEVE